MKNIHVRVDDETHARAVAVAGRVGLTVSAWVRHMIAMEHMKNEARDAA